MEKRKQKERIVTFIERFGSITHKDASNLGILGFTARMSELRQDGVVFYEAFETSLGGASAG